MATKRIGFSPLLLFPLPMACSFRQSALLLALGAVALGSCRKKEVEELEGPVPTATFTVALNTTVYPVVATFTNTSADGFLYQWDFGDGSPLASGRNVTHTYTLPRTYPVKLVVAGRGGTGTAPAVDVTIPSICSNAAFAVLIDCGKAGATSWTYSDQPGAIKVLAANGTTVISASAAPLPDCQADDQFQFNQNFTYTYDGGDNCGANLNGTSDFVFRPSVGLGQIVLQRNKSFIVLTDSAVNKTYDIIEATPAVLRLRSANPNGTRTEITLMPNPPPLVRAERLLTGGSSRTWVLDNTVASTITVGTEAAPTTYYGGGPLGSLPACQADDEYTFTSGHSFAYDAKADTFVAGVFACQAPRSLSTTFTFGAAAGAGQAQLVLAAPTAFIGATDAAPDRIYRILSINNRTMVLRAGGPTTDPVFTLKLRVK